MSKKGKTWHLILAMVIIIFFAPLAIYLWKTALNTDEKRVRILFNRGVRAVVERDYAAIGEILSASYDGDIGANRDEAIKIAQILLDRVEGLRVKPLTVSVTMEGEKVANLHSNFEYSGFYIGSDVYNRIPLSGGMPRAVPGETTIRFEKEQGAWHMSHVELILNGQRR
jgi:hypothetical protein